MNRVILAKVLFRSVCKGDSHMNASVTTLDGVNFVYKNAAHSTFTFQRPFSLARHHLHDRPFS